MTYRMCNRSTLKFLHFEHFPRVNLAYKVAHLAIEIIQELFKRETV
jgi:hypothetical protein